ncbi:MAG TPA: ECF transporter S component [Methanocella sp.]|uniref:ECF transporter S component n=1 Tax=Methanocella sp. TaxID=2052833 RepID=UPI002D03F080|nr:ECF transporter S component [Methanocella sp.]HTY90178.1 ECF transporter S component [Methanocella sp.]
MAPKYYFTTRDLLTVAILASLGGVMSTYVQYLANVINRLAGVPYGAGEIVAGLHIFWLVLMVAITKKPGAGVGGGLLKGLVEFLSGSSHGIFVVFISLLEGIFVEIGFWPFKKYPKLSYFTGGILGSFAYVLASQLLFNVYPNIFLLAAVGLLSIVSGAVFAGYFSVGIMDNLEEAGIVRREKKPEKKGFGFTATRVVAVILALLIVFSAIYYFALVRLKGDPLQFTVTGAVASPKDYYQPSYASEFVTINAKLDGAVTHLPAQNYTGLPVRYVLRDARVGAGAKTLDVVGSDGYTQSFNVSDIMDNDDLIIVQEDGHLRLVARGYPGQLWVDKMKMIKVY